MTEQEEQKRLDVFYNEVKKIYGKCEPVGDAIFIDDCFINTFTKKIDDKKIVFQVNENNLDEPYAVTIDFQSYELALDFLKG